MFSRPKPIQPEPGQESVWDYPRPAVLQDTDKHIQIIFNGETIAHTKRAKRVIETSHPPSYYIPPEDIKMEYLIQTAHSSVCECSLVLHQSHRNIFTSQGLRNFLRSPNGCLLCRR